jgi:plastocyanin
MSFLDSRSLSYLDCFAQKFSKPGRVRYRLATAAGACLPVEDDEFTIEVAAGHESKSESQQHDVAVRRSPKGLVADPPHLKIKVGDMVLWNTPDAATPGFTVRGEGPGGAFDSAVLGSEAVYTHAFGVPGAYTWVDAYGGRVSGVIMVRSPSERPECDGWLKALESGTLIHITESRAAPDRVEILTGQTVFWAVERASGISITDARLVLKKRGKEEKQRVPC